MDPKFHVDATRWVAPTNHSSSQNTTLNDLSYGITKSGQIFLPFCHNPRVCQTDGRTTRRTDRIIVASPRLHFMQRRKKVAMANLQAPGRSASRCGGGGLAELREAKVHYTVHSRNCYLLNFLLIRQACFRGIH